MKKTKIINNLFIALFAFGFMLVLVGCNADNDTNTPDAPIQNETTDVLDEDVDVYQDLQDALEVVTAHLDYDNTSWAQIMLSDDVPGPEMKYGLLVVPFFPSDLVERNTRTVEISGGNFTIDVVSAETSITWTINQDGVITGGN